MYTTFSKLNAKERLLEFQDYRSLHPSQLFQEALKVPLDQERALQVGQGDQAVLGVLEAQVDPDKDNSK